jgi:hypothetical protein
MKIPSIYLYVLLLPVLLLSVNLQARESEMQRELLIKYLHFYYIESPNKPNSPYKLNNAMIAQKNTCTQCGNFWKNPNTKQARDLLQALFSDTNQGGDLKLQRIAYHILKPNSTTDPKFIQIWIYDDVKEPLNQRALAVYQPCESEKGRVWPCAAGLKEAGFEKYGGFMHLGASHMRRIGAGKTKAAFLHELSHAQDHIVAETDASHFAQAHASHLDEPNLWLLNETGQQPKHTVIEAAPSWTLAYREALANTFDLVYNPDQAKRIFQWYVDNAMLLVDAVYNEETPDISEEEWLYHRISKDLANTGTPLSAKEYDPVIARYYKGYRMNDLPPAHIIRNEMIMALMFYGYINYVGLDEFNLSLLETNNRITQDKKREEDNPLRLLNNEDRRDPFRLLFYRLNISARPDIPLATLPTSSGRGSKSHLLLIAYIDYFTRYQIQSKEEFAKVFSVTHGKVTGNFHDLFSIYVDLYWAQSKDKVRKTVTLEDTTFEDLELIAKALDMPVPE